MPLVFELELFKPTISISFFGSETCITLPIALKIYTKNDSYVPQLCLNFKFLPLAVSKLVFSNFVSEFVIFHGKNIRTSEQSVAEVPIIKKPLEIQIHFWARCISFHQYMNNEHLIGLERVSQVFRSILRLLHVKFVACWKLPGRHNWRNALNSRAQQYASIKSGNWTRILTLNHWPFFLKG